MAKAAKANVAILVENNYQELEVWCPLYRLQEEGFNVIVVGNGADRYVSKLGYPVVPDMDAVQAASVALDGIIVPGGYAPDLIRANKPMVDLVARLNAENKVVAAICHGSWVLASAGILKGRRVTGAPSIKDDITNAGGLYEDAEVVVDGNIITSRRPADLPAFDAAIVRRLLQS